MQNMKSFDNVFNSLKPKSSISQAKELARNTTKAGKLRNQEDETLHSNKSSDLIHTPDQEVMSVTSPKSRSSQIKQRFMNVNPAQPSNRVPEISETFEQEQDEPAYLSEEKLSEHIARLKSEIALMNSQYLLSNKEFPSGLKVETFDTDQDRFFIKNLLQPYLSSVYSSLMKVQKKDYLSLDKLKAYLNLPEFIAEQLVKQTNKNSDERIDHVEFVGFFLRLLAGSLEQRMLIAFNCYDFTREEELRPDDVKVVLRNVPISSGDPQSAKNKESKVNAQVRANQDATNINELVTLIFRCYSDGLYFKDFIYLNTHITSELFFSLNSLFLRQIPCATSFLVMRHNFKRYLASNPVLPKWTQNFTSIALPTLQKSIDRLSDHENTLKKRGNERKLSQKSKSGFLPLDYKSLSNSEEEEAKQDTSQVKASFEMATSPVSGGGAGNQTTGPGAGGTNSLNISANLMTIEFNAIQEEVGESSDSISNDDRNYDQRFGSSNKNQKRNAVIWVRDTQNTLKSTVESVDVDLAERPTLPVSQIDPTDQMERGSDSVPVAVQGGDKSFVEGQSFDIKADKSGKDLSISSPKDSQRNTPLEKNYLMVQPAIKSEEDSFLKMLSPASPNNDLRRSASGGAGSNSLSKKVQAKKNATFLERQKLLSERLEQKLQKKKSTMRNLDDGEEGEAEMNEDESSQLSESNFLNQNNTLDSRRGSRLDSATPGGKKRRYSLSSRASGAEPGSLLLTPGKEETYYHSFVGVQDSFQIVLRSVIFKMSSLVYQLEASGAFRACYMTLTNYDLMIYPSKKAKQPEHLLVLGLGCLVKQRPMVELSQDQQVSVKVTEMYPVELYVGGGKIGNFGVHTLQNRSSDDDSTNGVFTFFFADPEVQMSWTRLLEQATGNLKFHDFYTLTKQPKVPSSANQILRKSTIVNPVETLGDATSILGKGRSGCSLIVEGVHNTSKATVAVKVLEKKSLAFDSHSEVMRMIKAYQMLRHPGVMKLEDFFETKQNYFICFELVENMTLFDYLKSGMESISENRAREMFQRIVTTVEFIHGSGFVLRNLSADSMLMTRFKVPESGKFTNELDRPNPIIASLKEARCLGNGIYEVGQVGDLKSQCPEMVMGRHYNQKADIWSMGVILYLLLSGEYPFHVEAESSNSQSMSQSLSEYSADFATRRLEDMIVQDKQYPDLKALKKKGISKEAINMVELLLTRNPKKRASIKQILEHSWWRANLKKRMPQRQTSEFILKLQSQSTNRRNAPTPGKKMSTTNVTPS